MLSDDLLAKISISTPPDVQENEPEIFPNPANPAGITGENQRFEFMFFAGHFLGDGVSFAVIANEFLTLIANDMSEEDLASLVQNEIDARVLVGVSLQSCFVLSLLKNLGVHSLKPHTACIVNFSQTRFQCAPSADWRSPDRGASSNQQSAKSSL